MQVNTFYILTEAIWLGALETTFLQIHYSHGFGNHGSWDGLKTGFYMSKLPAYRLLFHFQFSCATLTSRPTAWSVWFTFILEEVKHACQSAVYTYKVVRFFIKDYTNKDALRAVSKDGAESYTSLTRHKTRQGWCHYLGSLEVLSEGW